MNVVAEGHDESIVEKVMTRLARTRLHQVAGHYNELWKYRRLDNNLRREVDLFRPDVVMTVAHGPLAWLAKIISKQMELPLVTLFHDWWPYLCEKRTNLSARTLKIVRKRFFELHQHSDCVMPICEGMAEELGPHANNVIIPPIPSCLGEELVEPPAGPDQSGKIVYMGNMTSGYGAMLQNLIASDDELARDIRCFGNSEDWPASLRQRCQTLGILSSGPVPEKQLYPYLSQSLALLVTLPSDEESAIYQRTSFPSKLVSYLQYGRPLVFWGSEESSLIQWARKVKATAVFAGDSPEPVLEFLRQLRGSERFQRELCEESVRLRVLFDPVAIQDRFRTAIHKLAHTQK